MSESFEAHRMKCYEPPDDTLLMSALVDEVSDARESGDDIDLEWAEDRYNSFVASRHLLECCSVCGDRALKGKDVVVIYNVKDVVYECVLHWKCFQDSPGWQAPLLQRETIYVVDDEVVAQNVEGRGAEEFWGEIPQMQDHAEEEWSCGYAIPATNKKVTLSRYVRCHCESHYQGPRYGWVWDEHDEAGSEDPGLEEVRQSLYLAADHPSEDDIPLLAAILEWQNESCSGKKADEGDIAILAAAALLRHSSLNASILSDIEALLTRSNSFAKTILLDAAGEHYADSGIILSGLSDADWFVRDSAIASLLMSTTEKELPARTLSALALIDESDKRVRVYKGIALLHQGQLSVSEALDLAAQCLRDKRVFMRCRAVYLLDDLGRNSEDMLLRHRQKETNSWVLCRLNYVLAKLGERTAHEELRQLLEARDWRIRRLAAGYLGEVGRTEADLKSLYLSLKATNKRKHCHKGEGVDAIEDALVSVAVAFWQDINPGKKPASGFITRVLFLARTGTLDGLVQEIEKWAPSERYQGDGSFNIQAIGGEELTNSES